MAATLKLTPTSQWLSGGAGRSSDFRRSSVRTPVRRSTAVAPIRASAYSDELVQTAVWSFHTLSAKFWQIGHLFFVYYLICFSFNDKLKNY